MYTCSVGVSVTARPFQEYGAALTLATVTATFEAGDEDGEVIIHVTALDGGDETNPGDSNGVVTSLRWRTIDGIWHTLGGTSTGDYPVFVPEEYNGLSVAVYLQVIGTAGNGQTVSDTVLIPGIHYETYGVIDGTDTVLDGTNRVVEQVAV